MNSMDRNIVHQPDRSDRSRRSVLPVDESGTPALLPQDAGQSPRGADTVLLSPQDFYRRLVSRPDVRDLLARLAKR